MSNWCIFSDTHQKFICDISLGQHSDWTWFIFDEVLTCHYHSNIVYVHMNVTC